MTYRAMLNMFHAHGNPDCDWAQETDISTSVVQTCLRRSMLGLRWELHMSKGRGEVAERGRSSGLDRPGAARRFSDSGEQRVFTCKIKKLPHYTLMVAMNRFGEGQGEDRATSATGGASRAARVRRSSQRYSGRVEDRLGRDEHLRGVGF